MKNFYMEIEDQLFSVSVQLYQLETDLNSSMRDLDYIWKNFLTVRVLNIGRCRIFFSGGLEII